MMRPPRFAPYLVYESYDPQTRFFINRGSLGFVLHGLPLVGIGLREQHEITDFLSEPQNLPDGAALQVTLVGCRTIGAVLQRWAALRTKPLFHALAQRRVAHLTQLAESGIIRTCFLLVSLTLPTTDLSPDTLVDLDRRRDTLKSTFQAMGLPLQEVSDSDLVTTLRNWFEWPAESQPAIDPQELLYQQVVPTGFSLQEEPHQLLLNDSFALRALEPIKRPDSWSLPQMDYFLGDELRRSDSIRADFMLTTTLQMHPHQSFERARAVSKRETLGKTLKSGLSKWLPDLESEYHDMDQFVVALGEGGRTIRLFQTLLLKANPEQIDERTFTWRAMLRRHGFHFAPCDNYHLTTLLASLPMQPVEVIREGLCFGKR